MTKGGNGESVATCRRLALDGLLDAKSLAQHSRDVQSVLSGLLGGGGVMWKRRRCMRVAATWVGWVALVAGVSTALVALLIVYIAVKMPGPPNRARAAAAGLVGLAILLGESAGVAICVALDSLQVAPAYGAVFETAVYTLAGLEVMTAVTLVIAYFRTLQRRLRQ